MRTIILLLFILGVYACIPANESSTKQEQPMHRQNTSEVDTVYCSEIDVNGVLILASMEEVLSKIGNPDSIFTAIDDLSYPPVKFKVFKYGQSELYFEEDELLSEVYLEDNSIIGGVTKHKIKVGDEVARLAPLFPNSFNTPGAIEFKTIRVLFYGCENLYPGLGLYQGLLGRMSFKYDENQIIRKISINFLE